jgi:hypothetical protein
VPPALADPTQASAPTRTRKTRASPSVPTNVRHPTPPLGSLSLAPPHGQPRLAHLRLDQAIVTYRKGRQEGIVVRSDLGACGPSEYPKGQCIPT